MTQRERMDKGLIYDPGDSDIMTEQTGCLDLLYDFNDTRPSEGEKRQALLKKMFGSIGEGCYIEPQHRRRLLHRATSPRKLGRQKCIYGRLLLRQF